MSRSAGCTQLFSIVVVWRLVTEGENVVTSTSMGRLRGVYFWLSLCDWVAHMGIRWQAELDGRHVSGV